MDKDNKLGLDVGQANEIKLAARRAGATNADLKKLTEGDMFARVLAVIRGEAAVSEPPLGPEEPSQPACRDLLSKVAELEQAAFRAEEASLRDEDDQTTAIGVSEEPVSGGLKSQAMALQRKLWCIDCPNRKSDNSVFDPNSFTLVVDYNMKLEDLAQAGEYGYVPLAFTSANFPTIRAGKVPLQGGRLVHFARNMSNKMIARELDRMGLRPGYPHELVAFGNTFPDIQRDYPIVAFGGGRWRLGYYRYFVYLDGSRLYRKLDIGRDYWFAFFLDGEGWDPRWRFLAFPK